MTQLKIFEIFYSLQGESSRVGLPTIFIRLSGCPMRCHYCDTAYAFQGGSMMTIDEIMETIKKYHTHYVTVTGGEPLAQKEVLNLLKVLADQNFKVSLETGGGLSIKEVDPRIKIILDIKTPESGEEKKNYWDNLNFIHLKDEIKFVLCSREDYDWAKKIINQYKLSEKCDVLFSPVYQKLNITDLGDWILEDQLPVRMQIQLHKLLWGEKPGV
ncbi:MAG: 7-carboxy-7-deazaguanine synthase QueE [Candidatus Methylopumilus sp.]|nr:7-carboxy-7-deazaguanine synthase QueE [Betaproteobacteria bacterium]